MHAAHVHACMQAWLTQLDRLDAQPTSPLRPFPLFDFAAQPEPAYRDLFDVITPTFECDANHLRRCATCTCTDAGVVHGIVELSHAT